MSDKKYPLTINTAKLSDDIVSEISDNITNFFTLLKLTVYVVSAGKPPQVAEHKYCFPYV